MRVPLTNGSRITHHGGHLMDASPPPKDFFCSQLSNERDEPMAGTAVSTPVWLLLEYRQPWLAEATTNNRLPAAVQAHLHNHLTAVNGRLQFIRQIPNPTQLHCFVAIVEEQSARLYRFPFDDYRDLLDLDIPAICAGGVQFTAYRYTAPLTLVCTNGRRDRCCGLYGAALYREMAAVGGTAVWQTTHLVGHRFAPTLLSLPDGACYGRFTTNDIHPLFDAQQNGDLLLNRLRGRTLYDAPTQAADYFLRQHLNQPRLNALQHRQTATAVADQWTVQFHAPAAGQTYHVILQAGDPQPVYASCGGPAKLTHSFQLLNITAVAP
jgi:hypothetical protein